jgi:hypothetical protein
VVKWELCGNCCEDMVGGKVGIVWELPQGYGGRASGNCVGISVRIWWVVKWDLCGNCCEDMVGGQVRIMWELL